MPCGMLCYCPPINWKYSFNAGGSTWKYCITWLPYIHAWQFAWRVATLYISGIHCRSSFWFFLKSRKASSVTTFPNPHSTAWRTLLIALLNSISGGLTTAPLWGLSRRGLRGYAGSPQITYEGPCGACFSGKCKHRVIPP